MRIVTKWLREMFQPEQFNNLDISSITAALNDPNIRTVWIQDIIAEMIRINMEVDKRLLSGPELGLTDLCARRKAIQDVLEMVLSARRKLTQAERPNPRVLSAVNLDRVTV